MNSKLVLPIIIAAILVAATAGALGTRAFMKLNSEDVSNTMTVDKDGYPYLSAYAPEGYKLIRTRDSNSTGFIIGHGEDTIIIKVKRIHR